MKLGEQQRMPSSQCPSCGTIVDAATAMVADEAEEQSKPEPGCFTICVECSAIAVFGEDLRLVQASEADLAALPAETRRMLEKVSQAIRQNNLLRSKVKFTDSVEEAAALFAQNPNAHVIGVSKDRIPRRWEKARQARCVRCEATVFVNAASPISARVICVKCTSDRIAAEFQ
jgi:hypothetical protein